jgi:hypothetical protein
MKDKAVAAIALASSQTPGNLGKIDNAILVLGVGQDKKVYGKLWLGNRRDWRGLLRTISTGFDTVALGGSDPDAWYSLEGGIDSVPAVVVGDQLFAGYGGAQIYALGLDYQLWTRFVEVDQPPTPRGWAPLGGAFNSAPAVTRWDYAGMAKPAQAVGLGTNNQMYHKWVDDLPPSPAWPENIGGLFLSEPAVVTRDIDLANPTPTMDIFGIGTDGNMYHKFVDTNRAWHPAGGDWESLGGCFVSAPAVVSWSKSRLDVFGVGRNGSDNVFQMLHRYRDGEEGAAWGPADHWEPLDGRFDSAPAVVSWEPGRLDIFGLGTDDRVYQKTLDQSHGGWTAGWTLLGTVAFNSAPAAVSWGPGRLDVFGIGIDGHMYHNAFDSGQWIGWESLGGSFRIPRRTVSPALPASRTFTAAFTFPDGVALGGSAAVTFNEDGSGTFSGSFHDSGALSYDVGVAVAIKDAKGWTYTATVYPHVNGTFEGGSRDCTWNWSFSTDPATIAAIKANWSDLCFGCVEAKFTAQQGVDGFSLLPNLLIGVGQVISLVGK